MGGSFSSGEDIWVAVLALAQSEDIWSVRIFGLCGYLGGSFRSGDDIWVAVLTQGEDIWFVRIFGWQF